MSSPAQVGTHRHPPPPPQTAGDGARPKSYSEWRDELLQSAGGMCIRQCDTVAHAHTDTAGVDMYSQVERRKRQQQDALASVTHLRSMTEIYASAERPIVSMHDRDGREDMAD